MTFSLLLFPTLSFSQTASESASKDQTNSSSFDKAFQEYLSKSDEYDSAHQDYVLKRAQYLRFGTLKSQEDAQKSTLSMLQSRDEVVVAFISALRQRLEEAVGVSDSKRQSLDFRLSEESSWFSNHGATMASAGSLKDLIKDSDEAKDRYTAFQPLVYETLATVSLGRITDFQERTNDSYDRIKSKVEEIKKEEREEYKLSENKTQVIDRWLFESNNRIVRGQEKQNEADSKLTNLGQIPGAAFSEYNNSLSLLGEAQLFYKEASSFLKEVIHEIKIKD